MVKHKAARRYLREVKQSLSCAGNTKQLILRQIEESIGMYLMEKPGADYDALAARFGTPRQIAASYLEAMDASELSRHLRIGKKIVAIVGAAALAVVILWACTVSISLIDSFNDTNGFIVESVEVISKEEYLEMNGGTE